MTYKVLISDNLSKDIIYKFNEADIDVVYSPEMGKNSSLILNEIHNFDAIAIRSDTKINSALLNKATKLKVIGRAGIGIDNIDLKLASNKGIVVMNTPFGNATTTAEHTMAMIFSSARKIPAANESTHSGKWEKNNFIGTELSGKKLGVVGVGNIYASEALFMSGIHPSRLGKDITKRDCEKLVRAIKSVLKKSIKLGGSSINDHTMVSGKMGYFQNKLFVYGREGSKCAKRSCQSPIIRIVIAQRSSFYCSECQR